MTLKRPDGRSSTESRSLYINFDGLDRADGSARFGFGATLTVASVSGPIEVRLAAEQPSQATFEVNVHPLSGVAGTESKSLASSIRSLLIPSLLLSQNPRTLIQLVVQSLAPFSSSPKLRISPSLTASFINASTLALLSASYPMRGVVCAAGVGRVHGSRELILDPAEDELAWLDGGGAFAFLFASSPRTGGKVKAEPVWSSWCAAPFAENELVEAQAMALRASELVLQRMKEAMALTAQQPPSGQALMENSETSPERQADGLGDGSDEEKMEI